MKETWIPVKDFEEYYAVSDLGRVKRLRREVISQKTNLTIVFEEMILALSTGKSGYRRISLYKKYEKPRSFRVNRLVAQAFLGLEMKSKLVVMHLNNNKLDNRLCNLKVGTIKENVHQMHREGRAQDIRGSQNPMAKHDEIYIRKIKELYKSGKTIPEIAKQENKDYFFIYDVAKELSWKHIEV